MIMYNFKLKLIKSIFHVRNHINFYFFIISVISIILLLLKLMNLDDILQLDTNMLFNSLFQFLWVPSSIFIILFLPSYPFFLKIHKSLKLNALEKLGLTMVFNMSFYIVIGYFGNGLGFIIDANYFFMLLVVGFSSLLAIILIFRIRKNGKKALKFTTSSKELLKKYENFSFSAYIKRKVSWNGLLLIVFMFLLIIALLASVDIFGGTDPWYHIFIIKIITTAHSLPLNEYFGAMGFHIIGAVFHFFSGIDFIFIPNVFLFFTIPVTSLIIYNILRRIFSNKSLAIFGIFVLLISSLGFINLTFQYWPSSLVFIQGLTIFFLLYIRLKKFIAEDKPTWRDVLSSLPITYIYILFTFVALYLSHSLIALIFLISFAWIYLIYLVKDLIRGFDFVLIVLLIVIFLIFYVSNVSTGHLNVFGFFVSLQWFYLLLGALIITGIGCILILYLRTQITFEKGRFNLILFGKKFKVYTVIEKFFIPLVLIITSVFIASFFIANLFWLHLNLITVFVGFEVIVFVIFAIWGLVVFQNKRKGKPLFLWLLAFVFLILIGFLSDVFRGSLSFFSRLFYLSSPILAIGFISYIYKLIKMEKINLRHIKIFLIVLICYSSTVSYLELFSSIDFFSVNNNELSAVDWYLDNSDNKNTLILEFGWNPVFGFFDYPYDAENSSLPLSITQNYVTFNNSLINPENHIDENGTNILVALKARYNTDVFILLTKNYLTTSEMEFYGGLTEEQYEMYYSLDYLNRVFSVKSENGDCLPYYWVI